MFSKIFVYNQLKFIARLEEHEHLNKPNFSSYHIKPNDRFYYHCITRRQFEYLRYLFHLYSKKSCRTVQKYKASYNIRHKYQLMRLRKAISNIKSQSIFDTLPHVVQNEVFSYLDHQSLIKFSYAYPKYTHTVMRAQYWSKINCLLNEAMFSDLKGIEIVCRYLNKHLTKFALDCFIITSSQHKQFLRIFTHTPNLTHLTLRGAFNEDLIDMLISKTPNLKHLSLETNDLRGEQLEKLASMEKLESLVIRSCCIDDEAMIKFINKVKKLVHLDIKLSKIVKAETLQHLFSKHGKTLEALRISEASFGSHSFKTIGKCVKLKELSVSGYKFGSDLLAHVSKLRQLKLLEIEDCPKVTNSAYKKFFLKKSQFQYMKRLHLSNLDIHDDSLEAMSFACPHLEDLYIGNLTYISDSGLESSLKNLPKLTSLVLNSCESNFDYKLFLEVPKKLLTELEFLYVDISYMSVLAEQYFDHLNDKMCVILHESEYGFGDIDDYNDYDDEDDDDEDLNPFYDYVHYYDNSDSDGNDSYGYPFY